jgi:integrase/recombinase XerD
LNVSGQVLLEGFSASLWREGLADTTRRKYAEHVRHFLGALEVEPQDAARRDLESYLDGLILAGLSVSTIRLRIAALRRFYDYLDDQELLAGRNPATRLKAPKRRKKPNDWLRADEDAALYRACVTPHERIVHALLRYAGLRVGEACALLQEDVDLDAKTIRVRVSKSDSGLRSVPIADVLDAELRSWLRLVEAQGLRRPGLPLLVTKNATAMKPQFAWRVVKRAAHRANVRVLPAPKLSSISPHTLRRTFGSDLLNRGMRMETISKLLGHADTRVTEASYAEMLDETVRAEWDALAS